MIMRPDMSEYRAMAEDALRLSRATGTRRVVSNRGPHHAQAVTDVLVSNAEASLSFLCRSFSAEVFDTARIEEFLDKPGTRLNVLLDGEIGKGCPTALAGLSEHMAGDDPRLQVRRLAHASPIHFGIADGRDTRIETDVASRKATVVFGDAAFAAAAQQRFKSLWDAARKLTAAEIAPAA
ncbi:hypothetical protein [Methylobacterium sp. WL19]|uniref:hypothetical protein n=1 Tax=Methylobacterium sp. WL19 TaxID=2603896 RepID=UPI0011CB81CE|nr:hypothetical protein [Methylobacterium sp. WL19]TXN33537.1 hypothetical protein FV220_02020 [Methylobacterium sp. WL19]